MEDFNKIGLLILNEDNTKFLVCQKDNTTAQYLMPGGQLEEENDIECLKREIKEELNCGVDIDSLDFIGNYKAIAAGFNDRFVKIKLYKGKIIGSPVPSSEITALYWLTKEDRFNDKASLMIREKIIPDLMKKGLLK